MQADSAAIRRRTPTVGAATTAGATPRTRGGGSSRSARISGGGPGVEESRECSLLARLLGLGRHRLPTLKKAQILRLLLFARPFRPPSRPPSRPPRTAASVGVVERLRRLAAALPLGARGAEGGARVAVEGLRERAHLALERAPHELVRRVARHEVVAVDRRLLADTVRAVLCLQELSRHPSELSEEHGACVRQREPLPRRLEMKEAQQNR